MAVFWSASPDLLVVAFGLALPVELVVPLWFGFGLGLTFTSGGGGAFGFGIGVVCCVGFCTPLFVLFGVVGVVCAAANAPNASSNTEITKNFFIDV